MNRVIVVLCLMVWMGMWAPDAQAQGGASPNVLVLPTGPGSLGGIGENVQANLNMGLMSYQIRVLVPSGRGAATPNPSITYSSSGGASLLGIGWRFSMGRSIERGTVRGLPTYTDEDVMFAGGELVKLPGKDFYRARYEGGFVRYRWIKRDASDQGGYWLAEYPNGTKEYYGANAKGQPVPDAQVRGAQGTYRWELVTQVDRNGNRVEYTYFKEGSMPYPDVVSWVFDKNNKPLYQMKFLYETRKDVISDGKPGFDLQTNQRIREVQITSAGQRFRSYTFAFEESTGLSRLTKVTRYGRNENKAYPVSFLMTYSDATVKTPRLVTMSTSTGVNLKARNAAFIDMNGDGLPDLVDTSDPKHIFHFNQLTLDKDLKQVGHDFPSSLKKQNPKEVSAQLSNPTVQLLDVNGDGFTDLVDAVNMRIYVNYGKGKWEDQSEVLSTFPLKGNEPNMRFFDYDGDKKIDVISSDGSITQYFVNNGKGKWLPVTGVDNIGLSFSKDKLKLIDMNGDGLMDVVHITSDTLRYKKYLGYGKWSQWITVSADMSKIRSFPVAEEAQFNDMNGDGLADMVMMVSNKIFYMINRNGTRFDDPIELKTDGLNVPDKSQRAVRIVDINGNGSRDIVWVDSSGKVSYLELFDKRPNLMTAISNGIGQRINVAYGSSVNFFIRDSKCDPKADKACNGPWQNKMPMAFPVVTKITTWASRDKEPTSQVEPSGDASAKVQHIYYHDGFYDGKEKAFRGFRHVETLFDADASMGARKEEIKYNVGDSDPYYHGKLLLQSVQDDQGKVFKRFANEYGDCPLSLGGIDGKALPFPIRYICLKAQEVTHIEGTSDQGKWKLTRFQRSYDGYGNIILENNLGEKDKKGDEKITKTTYIKPADPNDKDARWLLRFPSQVENCASVSGPCSLTEYYYDGEPYKGLPLGQLDKGNLSRQRDRKEEGVSIDTARIAYDLFGNMVGSLSPRGLKRTFTWDQTYSRFPAKEVIELDGYKLEMSTEWDLALSRVIRSTDVNGYAKQYVYDLFGRISQIFHPGDQPGQPSQQFTYILEAPISRVVTEHRSKTGGAFDHKEIACVDGLGRMLSRRIWLKDNLYMVAAHREYNREGLTARSWQNYHADETCTFVAPDTVGSINYTYDGMNRPLRKVLPDGSFTRAVYEPFKVTVYDEADNKEGDPAFDTPTVSILDGLNRVVEKIVMPKQGETISTQYKYSHVNVSGSDLNVEVTFADGSIKKQSFDQLGNLLKVVDPDRSILTYTYNEDSLITSVLDARGVKVVYTYDKLKRVLTRQQEGKDETKVSFFYDKAQEGMSDAKNLLGRIAALVYPGGALYNSYNARGKLLASRHLLLGHAFEVSHLYNNANQMTNMTYPDGRAIALNYDKLGRIISVPGKWEQLTYDARGVRTGATLSNGINLTYKYDKRLRLTDIQVGKVMSMKYTFDVSNNPIKIQQTHGPTSFTSEFGYDALYRLLQATLADHKETLSYQQDQLHNITAKVSSLAEKSPAHVGDYTYDQEKIHAAIQAGKWQMSYDKAGNLIKRNDLSLTWDHLNRLKQVKRGQEVIARYWYTNTHRRSIKEENGVYTFYIGPSAELREGAFVNYLRVFLDRKVASWSVKGVAAFFDDMNKDGQIDGADAWRYYAHKAGLLKSSIKERPIDVDLTKTMLASSAMRMLLGDKEEVHYYHADQMGNVRAITNAKGEVLKRTHYTPYGVIREESGNTSIFSYGYQGQEYDQALGVWAFLKRSFDPRLGRWLSADPAFASINGTDDEFNSYGMTENNPMAFRDFLGASKIRSGLAKVASLSAMAVGGVMMAGIAGDNVPSLAQPYTTGGSVYFLAGGALALTGVMVGAISTWRSMRAKATPTSPTNAVARQPSGSFAATTRKRSTTVTSAPAPAGNIQAAFTRAAGRRPNLLERMALRSIENPNSFHNRMANRQARLALKKETRMKVAQKQKLHRELRRAVNKRKRNALNKQRKLKRQKSSRNLLKKSKR